ncbi:Far-red impaired responsive (FAR1) family protein [Striga asiatica]|uniref:Far-red impaired responsive (FAR1) family protein n=1 Tax=Striga asiatica TaxID=4170 RepID=A0A5A7QZG5_STRAF|nr:Far-red impaired responsive (FAR1) family protein [Striga asiatica]
MSMQKFVAHSISGDENDEDSGRSFDEQFNTSLADGCEAKGDYIVQVAFASIPRENQSFQTLDEAKDFYIAYSKEAGFSVRERNDRKNHKQEVVWKMFVCYKE